MTDRAKGFTIALKEDIRVDDMDSILNALKMVKGVLKVEPIINDGTEIITEMRLKNEFKQKLLKWFDEV